MLYDMTTRKKMLHHKRLSQSKRDYVWTFKMLRKIYHIAKHKIVICVINPQKYKYKYAICKDIDEAENLISHIKNRNKKLKVWKKDNAYCIF